MLRVHAPRFRAARRRDAIWLLTPLPLVVGLLIGLFTPQSDANIELGFGARNAPFDDSNAPILLAGEYHDTSTTLWLSAANDPSGDRQRLASIPHAWGWDIEAAVAPDQQTVAVLAILPGGADPQRDAALLRVDASSAMLLATDLELRGGIVWSDDGERIVARRAGAIAVFDAQRGTGSTVLTANSAQSLHPVALRGDGLWVVSIDAAGSHLLQLDAESETNSIIRQTRISEAATREWTISPDGSRLAFTAQHGSRLSVRVVPIDATQDRWVSTKWGDNTHRRAGRGDAVADRSSPVWRSDGGLALGNWRDAAVEGGFSLPLAWCQDDSWLALRSFSGSGLGDVGEERLTLRGPDGVERLAPLGLAFIGWWRR